MKNTIYTNTSLRAFRTCPRRYQLSFVEGYKRKEVSQALSDGILWHLVMEKSHTLSFRELCKLINHETMRRTNFPSDERRCKFIAMTKAYIEIKGIVEVQDVEVEFMCKLNNPQTQRASTIAQVSGKIDGITRQDDGLYLLEHKCLSRIDIEFLRHLDLDHQCLIYKKHAEKLYGEEVKGVIYDVIQKPTIRMCGKDDNDPVRYGNRVIEWYRGNRETAFYREKIQLRELDIETELYTLHKMIRFCHSMNHFPRHSESCNGVYGQCEFYNYCVGDNQLILDLQFNKVDNVHPELNLQGGNDDDNNQDRT